MRIHKSNYKLQTSAVPSDYTSVHRIIEPSNYVQYLSIKISLGLQKKLENDKRGIIILLIVTFYVRVI